MSYSQERDFPGALRGAYYKGYDAGYDGKDRSNNPYDQKAKTKHGRPTFSYQFWRAWEAGFEDGTEDRMEDDARETTPLQKTIGAIKL